MSDVKKNLLTREQFDEFCKIVVECFDTEIVRLHSSETIRQIANGYADQYAKFNYATYFVPLSLTEIVNDQWKNPIVREFVMSFTERVSFHCSTLDLDANSEVFYKTLTEAICRTKTLDKVHGLIPTDTQESIASSPESITKVLQSNFWLVVHYVLMHNFHLTQFFTTIAKTDSAGKSQRPTAKQ